MENFIFNHLFPANFSGPTACGKVALDKAERVAVGIRP